MTNPILPTSPSVPTRILCVDDSSDITAVMRLMIGTDPAMQCVGCLASADHLIDEVRRQSPPPDVVILDATMPGKSPLKVMTELAAEFPHTRTIIYSAHDDPAFIEGAHDAGAWGCVSKNDEPNTILRAVREVAAGNTFFRP